MRLLSSSDTKTFRASLSRQLAARIPGCPLTPRQVMALQALLSSGGEAQAARDLGIALRTLERHLANIRELLGAETTLQTVAVAVDRGWIAVPKQWRKGLRGAEEDLC